MKSFLHEMMVFDFLAVGILLSALSINAFRRLESYVGAYQLNSWCLGLYIAAVAYDASEAHLYLGAVITIVGKGVLIPLILRGLLRKMRVNPEVQPFISNALSLTISGILIAIVYGSLSQGIAVTGLEKNAFQIGIAVILIGLFIMITRRKAITQVCGLLFMENGLFLAGFALTWGMPAIIELGLVFDLLVGVILLGVFTVQIKRSFGSMDLDKLRRLQG